MSARTIDAHLHLWRYEPEQYDWIDATMGELRRDYLPAELERAMKRAAVDGAIAVQARQSLAETDFLLALADEHPTLLGVVGWAPLREKSLEQVLESLEGRPKLKGLRHVIQAEPDDEFILRPDFSRGIRALRDYGLTYDILIFERHLPFAISFVDQHPEQVFVVDHLAKPLIARQELEPWATFMKELARRENVFCKLSGMVTEDDWRQRPSGFGERGRLGPYLDLAVEAFGPGRLVAGSDWPVCLLGTSYEGWFSFLQGYFASFSTDEQAAIFGGNAVRAYRL